jgi:transcriptional regulator with XRE-family HTH domain|tara:strand:+ start:564 stop:770 length:207 start_codon:yes stop_codon:yes gene_type:complete
MITPMQIRMARAGLNISIQRLQSLSGVNASTISYIERERRSPLYRTMMRLQDALEKQGVTFVEGGAQI